jgi:hypothetical protein
MADDLNIGFARLHQIGLGPAQIALCHGQA